MTIKGETLHIRLSPTLFSNLARDYFRAYLNFQRDAGKFSAVPFFLCCRAIELALKGKHLEKKSQIEVKRMYSHDLMKSYSDLDPTQQTLTPDEQGLLTEANDIYAAKAFEYLNVYDAATAFKRFPDLGKLASLAHKILSMTPKK